jgi:hypothetical protein
MPDVHDLGEEFQERNEISEELTNAFSQPSGFATEIDDVG